MPVGPRAGLELDVVHDHRRAVGMFGELLDVRRADKRLGIDPLTRNAFATKDFHGADYRRSRGGCRECPEQAAGMTSGALRDRSAAADLERHAARGALEAIARASGAGNQPIARPRRDAKVPGQTDDHRRLGLGDEKVVAPHLMRRDQERRAGRADLEPSHVAAVVVEDVAEGSDQRRPPPPIRPFAPNPMRRSPANQPTTSPP